MTVQFCSARGLRAIGATALLAAALTGSAGQAALAQAVAPPAYGPPIAGLCLFAQAQAVGQSKIGASANQQLEQYVRGIDAELKAAAAPIISDDHALAAQKASMPNEAFQQQAAKLRQRYDELGHTRQLREAQLALTRKDALTQVAKVMGPSLSATISDRHCSVVFERAGAYGMADGMDITTAVIQRMDAAQPSISLTLATPEAAQQAAAPAR